MFRTAQSVPPIAIDIGGSSIKMLQLEQRNGNVRVLAAGRFYFPAEARQADERQNSVSSAIRKLLREHRFKGSRIVSMVPNHAIQFKSFRIPNIPDHELDDAARFEAEERFAFEDPAAEFRFLSAGEVRQGQDVRREIIAMGCTSDVLKEQLEIFDGLKLQCLALDVSPSAVVRCFTGSAPTGPEDTQIYADLGYRGTRITICRGGRIIFVKAIAIGGQKITEQIAMKLNLSLPEATQLRREMFQKYADGDDAGRLQEEVVDAARDAARPAMEQLSKEIGLCLRYYSVTFRGVRPESLVCVGGDSYDDQMLKTITEVIGVKAERGAPLKAFDTENVFSIEQRRSGLLEWATVTGLAMRESHQQSKQEVTA